MNDKKEAYLHDLQAVQEQIDGTKAIIETSEHALELGQCLDRLMDNPDFQKLFLKNYCETTALAQIHNMESAQCRNEFAYASFQRCLVGVGQFRNYIDSIRASSNNAINAVADAKVALVDLEQELLHIRGQANTLDSSDY